jgi:type II secretory ATPase GspE/PulE/Tfp pilus assembly ATPase PilB-like protein
VTLERTVSYVVPDFVQVEVAGEFAAEAATILTQPADVILLEELGPSPLGLAAVGSAEQGALVLIGLAAGTNATGLARLLALDVPRAMLLSVTAGLANIQRQGARHRVSALALTDELRHELQGLTGPPTWMSRIS